MAAEVQSFQPLIPAGTPKATPVTINMTMPDRLVEEIEIRIPPGPRGEVGFAIGAAGVPVLPLAAGTFIVTDDEVINWRLEHQIDSGAWQLFGYNTGTFDHTLYIRFLVTAPGLVQAGAPVAPIPGGQLAGPGEGPGPRPTPLPPGPPAPVPPPPAPPPPPPPPVPPPPPPPPVPPPPRPPGPPGPEEDDMFSDSDRARLFDKLFSFDLPAGKTKFVPGPDQNTEFNIVSQGLSGANTSVQVITYAPNGAPFGSCLFVTAGNKPNVSGPTQASGTAGGCGATGPCSLGFQNNGPDDVVVSIH